MYCSPVDVHLILIRADGWVLLAERRNTGYADGLLNLPSGKLEEGEDVRAAVIREAREEIAVRIDDTDLRCASVLHHRSPGGNGRVGFFFAAERWHGEPVNAEPHKCAQLRWADPDALPPETVSYTAAGLRAFRAGRTFDLHGWDPDRSSPLALGEQPPPDRP